MGERKVLNKYYPPDFDPSMLPKVRRTQNKQLNSRTMLSMSIRCNTCGNYMYAGTKFNSRKEVVVDETYLGIQIHRFYFKCTRCAAELIMKTDPQNSDYIIESGATRNFEPWRQEDQEADSERLRRDAEAMGDAMKSLENRTLDSKREMDILAALDEMKSLKCRHATVSLDAMLEALKNTTEKKDKNLEEEDESLVKSIVFHRSKDFVQRIDDVDLDDKYLYQQNEISNNFVKLLLVIQRRKISDELPSKQMDTLSTTSSLDSSKEFSTTVASADTKSLFKSTSVRASVIKKPVASISNSGKKLKENKQEKEIGSSEANNGLLSLSQYYGSDDD